MTSRVRIIGPGRAGGSFAAALSQVGWDVSVLSRDAPSSEVRAAAGGVDLVLITTPDAAVEFVAAMVEPAEAVVAHVAGSLGLSVLAHHERRAALHPLMALPNPAVGAARLQTGGWFGIAGDKLCGEPLVRNVVVGWGGRCAVIADEDRAKYHAAAAIAANHVVAVLAQVERLAADVGMPMEAYLALTRGSVDDVAVLGARRALTGPAARGDRETLDAHRSAIADAELSLYNALATAAAELARGEDDGACT